MVLALGSAKPPQTLLYSVSLPEVSSGVGFLSIPALRVRGAASPRLTEFSAMLNPKLPRTDDLSLEGCTGGPRGLEAM